MSAQAAPAAAGAAPFPLARRFEDTPWLGRLPTPPDSRPVISAVRGRQGLWMACGHQQIGFSTGAGTAALLGALTHGDALPIDPHPFRASRFLRSKA